MDIFSVAKVKKRTIPSVDGEAEQQERVRIASRCVNRAHAEKDGLVVLASLESIYTYCSSNPGYLLNRTALIPLITGSHEQDRLLAAAATEALRKKLVPSSLAFVRITQVPFWLPFADSLVLFSTGSELPQGRR